MKYFQIPTTCFPSNLRGQSTYAPLALLSTHTFEGKMEFSFERRDLSPAHKIPKSHIDIRQAKHISILTENWLIIRKVS